MDKKFEINIDSICIEGERKKVKNLHLRLTATGKVKLSAPLYVSDAEIGKFVTEKLDWLKKHLKTSRTEEFWKFDQGGYVLIFAEPYKIVYNAQKNAVSNGIIFLKTSYDVRETALKAQLKKILKKKTEERLPFWEEKTGLYASSFVIRDMTTRWGTCNVKTRRICINLQLVKKREECLDYILVHELGHIINRFHDKRFYNYMNYNFPDYKRVKKSLGEP